MISNLGLCISVYDIESIKDHFILPNDGHPTLTVCIFTWFWSYAILVDSEVYLCSLRQQFAVSVISLFVLYNYLGQRVYYLVSSENKNKKRTEEKDMLCLLFSRIVIHGTSW